MAQSFSIAFYRSKAWKKCRSSFVIYKHGLCERCGKPGKIVHHKDKLTPSNINNPEITLNFDKLELLCQDCHNKEHMGNSTVAVGLMFDEYGNLIQKE